MFAIWNNCSDTAVGLSENPKTLPATLDKIERVVDTQMLQMSRVEVEEWIRTCTSSSILQTLSDDKKDLPALPNVHRAIKLF